MFANDSSVIQIVNKDISLCAAKMNKDLDCINNWAVQWLVSINTTKKHFHVFYNQKTHTYPPLKPGTVTQDQVFSHKHLGVTK